MPVPTYSIDLPNQALVVYFSPYEWCQDIICIAFPDKISVSTVKFHDNSAEFQNNVEFCALYEFKIDVRCHAITLASETSLSTIPKLVNLAIAGNDFRIRIFKSDLSENTTTQILCGHTDYINEISFDPENTTLASVSDDQTARVWDTQDNSCKSIFYLSSAGVSVNWHKDDPGKLMVAEKCGLIIFYNVYSEQPILSLDCGALVSSASWAPSDCKVVTAIQQKELLFWDITKPSHPAHSKIIHTEIAGNVKVSNQGNFVATVSRLDSSLKVMHVQSKKVWMNTPVLIPTNLTWHFKHDLLCLGDDMKLNFWKFTAK